MPPPPVFWPPPLSVISDQSLSLIEIELFYKMVKGLLTVITFKTKTALNTK